MLADALDIEDFVYDGCGHRIILPEGISANEALPLILVGAGKTLLLRNVRLIHAASLPGCLQLGPGDLPGCYILASETRQFYSNCRHPTPCLQHALPCVTI